MKIVQSFWTKPYLQSGKNLTDARLHGGWPHRLTNYYSWALSSLQLRKFYDDVELVTDELGYELLVRQLQLPYTNVKVTLNKLDHYHAGFWALGKLYTYALQQEPFLHVDSDIFIFRPFGEDIAGAALVTQNLEERSPGYTATFKRMCETLKVPDYCKHLYPLPITPSPNAGIMGGNDVDFIRSYVKEAFDFLDNNMDIILQQIDHMNVGNINVIAEQVILYTYAQKLNKNITYLFPNEDDIPPNIGFFQAAATNKYFVHCLGFYKKLKLSYTTLEWKIQHDYPDYYERINSRMYSSLI